MTSHSRFVNSSDARSEANVSSRRSDRLSSAIYTAPGLFIPSKALDHPADSNKEHTDVDNRLRNGARSISECADRHLGVIVRRDPTARQEADAARRQSTASFGTACRVNVTIVAVSHRCFIDVAL